MKRVPSVKKLLEAFPELGEKVNGHSKASLLRRVAKASHDPTELSLIIDCHCPKTRAYAMHAWAPWHTTMALSATKELLQTLTLHAIDELLGTHGVEALGEGCHRLSYAPPYEYCNAGDPYAGTLIYKRDADRLFIGCCGDLVESGKVKL